MLDSNPTISQGEASKTLPFPVAEKLSPLGFLDYRRFLAEFYAAKKERQRSFSYRIFSSKTGVASPNYMKLIIDGERSLTPPHARRVAKYCELNEAETGYFLTLVQWQQSKRPEEREVLWSEILRQRGQANGKQVIPEDQLAVLTRWQSIALLEMIRLPGFVPTYENTKRLLRAPISEEIFGACLQDLLRTGLIRKTARGYQVVNKNLVTSDAVPSQCIRDYHRQVIGQALKSLEGIIPAEREFNATTVAISKSDVPKLKAEIKRFRDLVLEMAGRAKDADSVYQLNVQLFPLTNNDNRGGDR